jgi:hypothetical protein
MKGCGSSLSNPIVSSYGWEEQFCVLHIVCHIGNKRKKRTPQSRIFCFGGAKIRHNFDEIPK